MVRLVVRIGVLGACVLGGCMGGGGGESGEGPEFRSSLGVTADWNDVTASVDLGASRSEMTLVRVESETQSSVLYLLRTIRDEPAWLAAELEHASDPAGEGTRLVLRAKVGRFGDPERESGLLANVRSRLRELGGVATREIK